MWSGFTFLTPLVSSSFGALILVRVALGMTEGVCWPAAHALLNKWFPSAERGRAVAFFTAGAHFGNILTIIVAPPLVVSAGWQWAFFLFGGSGFVFLGFWIMFVHERPADHPTISAAEIAYIEHGSLTEDSSSSRVEIPWRLFFTTKQLWGMYLNFFASGFGMFVLAAWMPTYFTETFNVPLKDVGAYTIGPYICQVPNRPQIHLIFLDSDSLSLCSQALGMVLAGIVSKALVDRGYLSALTCCTVMQLIALGGPIIFFAILISVPTGKLTASSASVILAAGLGFSSFNVPGVQTYAQLVVPRFAALLFAIANSFGVLPGAIGILAAGVIKEALHSFTMVFVIAIVCYCVGIVAWLVLVRGRPTELDEWESRLNASVPVQTTDLAEFDMNSSS
jgi:MFS family permease